MDCSPDLGAELYTYSPLESSEIRVARFTQDSNGELQATIEHVEVDPEDPFKVEFSALSYVWGDPKSTTYLNCNGEKLKITTALEEALHAVIKHNPNDLLWVDQICINQNDVKDKSREIVKMHMIYDGMPHLSTFVAQYLTFGRSKNCTRMAWPRR
jgi:hypothetical protein